MIKYNSKAVKGREIHDYILKKFEGNAEAYNNYVSGFKK